MRIMKTKKIPLRRCTGCNEMKEKKELVRIVKSDESGYFLDASGKKSGRGAYVCKNKECLQKAHKSRGLERSFKAPVPKEVYEELLQLLEADS